MSDILIIGNIDIGFGNQPTGARTNKSGTLESELEVDRGSIS